MTGKYSTIEQLTGERSFQIELTLNMPEHKDNWIYVIWLQIVDPYNSNPSRDFYEGYSVGL